MIESAPKGLSLQHYVRISRTPWYSLVAILPLVALYEAMALLINWQSPQELRNGADALVRLLLTTFGLQAPYIMGAALLVALVAAWGWHRKQENEPSLEGLYLVAMLVEGGLWGTVLLGLMLVTQVRFLASPLSDIVLQMAFLSVGAGIYEEALFRLGFISLLWPLFRRFLAWRPPLAAAAAVCGAALLFALFHDVGLAVGAVDWNSFVYRSIAGILLGTLFMVRGFGITVYAHTFYDLLVLGIRTLTT